MVSSVVWVTPIIYQAASFVNNRKSMGPLIEIVVVKVTSIKTQQFSSTTETGMMSPLYRLAKCKVCDGSDHQYRYSEIHIILSGSTCLKNVDVYNAERFYYYAGVLWIQSDEENPLFYVHQYHQ